MAALADKPALHLTEPQWVHYLETVAHVDGVRLLLRKKGRDVTGMTWSEALDVALCFGWIDGQGQRVDDDWMLTAFQPRRRASVWSQVNREHVARLVDEGRMRAGGLAEVERAKADGRWEAAYRQKDAVAPPDLRAALDADPVAAAFWESTSKTEKFRVYFRLAALKRPETRAARIADVVAAAARGEHHYR
ncbi:uncharacterized protein YdeI (YjbR/CyaY-like superfamily) [Frigoribacterium sp. PhB160]|uniref:YdeI/OmpD-associated family protein n=1 Tax=Frigoribacterium sp. PhB160 TaxID=2485192 RepID=UPI000F4A0535|nr:YdeI/OmpD-associated family protein [Frigoribacterium sp. PhB160]ROS57984.1 uncharacterized protein YdeI (YjbR/CyaY-like superfamily) [Frigoribacterium sp. PhB160]